MPPKNKFVIIDALAIAYKSYFAFINRPLTNSKGEPTSAIYGFFSQLIRILEATKPDYISVAFDSKEKTFRHNIYENYKSSRAVMPDDMIPQLDRIKEILNYLNIPILIMPGYEADDIVGTAAKLAEENNLETFAVTPDKDYIQLITYKTSLIIPGKASEDLNIIGFEKAKEKYQFEPIQMIDFLALVGDSSDDIPGVAGVGPKTALPLIQEFNSIENIYNNIDKISKVAVRNKLVKSKDNAFLSKILATIKLDVPIDINFEDAKLINPDFIKLNDILSELELKSILQRFNKFYNVESEIDLSPVSNVKDITSEHKNYKLINNDVDAQKLANELASSEYFVFDTETDSLDVFSVNLLGVSFSIKNNDASYVQLISNQHDDLYKENASNGISIESFRKIFGPLFSDPDIKKICQNGKYDIAVLRTHGIILKGFYFDTMLASYVIDPDQKHNMNDLSEKYLNYTPIPISTLIGDKKDAKKLHSADINQLTKYSCEDADITLQLYQEFSKNIKEEALDQVSYEIEFPLVPVLEDMERTGVKVDPIVLNNFSQNLQASLETLTANIYKAAETEFNINSPKQLQVILYDKLNLTPTKKTKTGYSTDIRALESLKGHHEIVDHLIQYRQAAKLKSTYADALPRLIRKTTGRIHTTFNQTVASTGRLSSLNPNLQNIPIRTDMGKEIRKAFIPSDKNHTILSADYSQIELRIMASISEDEKLMRAFKDGEDIHKSTAALVFMVPLDEVTKDMRRKAKEVNFGILYGIGAFGLKTRLGITQSHAKEIIETYFSTFKNIRNFIDSSIEFAQKHGYAKTLNGRRRFLKNINSKNRVVKQFEERVAVNMPIQGTAADMIKIAMINVFNRMNKYNFKSKMILQVHDELLFDTHKDEMEDLKQLVIEEMTNALPLNVPIGVDTGFGDNWLDAH